ncbi:MAG: hypothetical protein ABSE73_33445 [Planctomycetota bacterium]
MDSEEAKSSDASPATPPEPNPGTPAIPVEPSPGTPATPAAPGAGDASTGQRLERLGWLFLPYLSLLAGAGLLAYGLYKCRAPSVSSLWFACHFLYLKNGSSMYVDALKPHSDFPVLAASFVLAGLLLGFGLLILSKSFSLKMLLAAVLAAAGLGFVPAFIEKPSPGYALLDARFGKQLSARQTEELEERLQVGQLAGHAAGSSGAGTESIVAGNVGRLVFDLKVSGNTVSWWIVFPQGLPLGHGQVLVDYCADYFHDATTQPALELGLPAVMNRVRIAR